MGTLADNRVCYTQIFDLLITACLHCLHTASVNIVFLVINFAFIGMSVVIIYLVQRFAESISVVCDFEFITLHS